MKMNKSLCKMMAIVLGASLFMTGCGESGSKTTPTPEGPTATAAPTNTPEPTKYISKADSVTSDSIFVSKVENYPDDFIIGMDASSCLSLEAGGVKYYDFDGKETDLFQILADNGFNYIRVRVWNDPYDKDGHGYGGGNCDINTAVEIGKRATKYGMKLMVDFHYSDFWADPAKQMVPKAWKDMDIDTKSEALYQYTKESLQKLVDAGVDVGMVSLGNETNGSMCGETIWRNIIFGLMTAGSKATREVCPNALIAVHFANPEKVTNYADYAKKLDYYALDYDVFASSYYPYWHGTLDNLATVLSDVATKYGKKVMVAETSYAFTSEDSDFFGNTISDGGAVTKDYPYTIQGQVNCIRNIVDTVVNKTKNGIGVCYWEGTWISAGGSTWEENSALWEKYGSGWAASYAKEYDPKDAGKYYGGTAVDNQTFFDSKGHPLESLKMFALFKKGNEVALKADAIQDTTLIIDLNGEIVLPDKVNAVMSDNSKQQIDVEWKNVDINAMKTGGVKKYDIVGNAGGMEAHCYVSMVEYNFLQNYSFENGDDGSWTAIKAGNMDELSYEDKSTDSLTGSWHYHFWSSASDSVNFDLEQKVENLPAGTYKYTISIMGGDCGTTNIYSYVKINDKIIDTAPLTINGYGNWDTAVIPSFEYKEGDSITVGIHVQCSGEGNGAWGKIDDALLNSVSK